MGSHSEVIQSHGENYVGHQKSVIAALLEQQQHREQEQREGNSQNLHNSKNSPYREKDFTQMCLSSAGKKGAAA